MVGYYFQHIVFCRYTKNGLIATAGFSDPIKDPLEDDLKLWMPDDENPPKDLDLRMSRYLLAQVGDQFCDLYQQEKDAMSHHLSDGNDNYLVSGHWIHYFNNFSFDLQIK